MKSKHKWFSFEGAAPTRPPARPTQAPTTVRSTTEEYERPFVDFTTRRTTTTERTTTERTTTQRSTQTWWWTPPPTTPRATTRPWWITTTTRTTTTDAPAYPYPPDAVDVPAPPPESGPCTEGEKNGVPGDCKSFKQCFHGKVIILSCPEGLHWNQKMKICDWPANAKCSGKWTSVGLCGVVCASFRNM